MKKLLLLSVASLFMVTSAPLYAQSTSSKSVSIDYTTTFVRNGVDQPKSKTTMNFRIGEGDELMVGSCAPGGCDQPGGPIGPEGDSSIHSFDLILVPTFTDTGVYLVGALIRYDDDGRFIARLPIRKFFAKDGDLSFTVNLPPNQVAQKSRAYKLDLKVKL